VASSQRPTIAAPAIKSNPKPTAPPSKIWADNRESFSFIAISKVASMPATKPAEPKNGAPTMNAILARRRRNAKAPTTPMTRAATGHASNGEK